MSFKTKVVLVTLIAVAFATGTLTGDSAGQLVRDGVDWATRTVGEFVAGLDS